MTEGISDFHTFSVICRDELEQAGFELLPGLGASASGPLISFFLAAGRPFIILLDDDAAGRKEKKAYISKWFLDEETVLTLGDLDNALKGKKLENLLSNKTNQLIRDHFNKSNTPKATKKEIGMYFSEMSFQRNTATRYSSETRRTTKKILGKLEKRIEILTGK